MKELLNGQNIDTAGMFQEIAYYAERSDITEELVRLEATFHNVKLCFKKKRAEGESSIF